MNREERIEKVFPHSLFGYDPVAVDAFLDEVIREFDRMTNTIDVLQFKLAQELGEAKPINELLAPAQSREEFEERVEALIASVQPQIEAPAEEAEPAPAKEPAAPEAPEEEPKEPEEANGPAPEKSDDNAENEELDAPAFVPEAEEEEPPAEEIRLMTRREIKKMIREEKALERKVRREKKK